MRGYIIETITNTHVGSGDINFGVVDNLVQKDAITNIPVIHSSSLKGAFRDYFENLTDNKDLIEYIFGQDNTNSETKRPGAYQFFEAKLLTRPVRSNVELFFNATSPQIIREFLDMCEIANIELAQKDALEYLANLDIKEITAFSDFDDVYLEDEKVKVISKNDKIKKAEEFLGRNIALYPIDRFKELDLPFIARNNLDENGISKNLWYEEVVPSRSKFYFFIKQPTKIAESVKSYVDEFDKQFNSIDVIQIGANKSIGYGFCRLKEIK